MKRLFAILVPIAIGVGITLTTTVFAQSPQKMSYQAVIRNSSEGLVVDTEIGMQISILQDSVTGSTVYVETQTLTTNANGLVSLEIGAGNAISGNFAAINWAEGPYFIKTETDPTGGTSYTITGTSQLLSVPYALHANEVDPSVPRGTKKGEMQYWNGSAWVTVAPGTEGGVLTFINGVPTWNIRFEIVEVENPTTGKTWLDRNLGAAQVATSSKDAAAYGDLYQWGRGTDGHEKRTSGKTNILSSSDTPGHGDFITINFVAPNNWRNPENDNLWQGVNGINNPCPEGYRIPTEAEFVSEIESWSSADAAGAFSSPLKFTLAGLRDFSNAKFYGVGSGGDYWSSTLTEPSDGSRHLGFSNSYARMSGAFRADGYSVRCIKD